MVGGGLRRVVGRAWTVRRRFAERVVAVERQVTVDLARRDVVEAVDVCMTRSFEQELCTDHVGAREEAWIENRETIV